METFSASLAICTGNSPVLGEFPSQRPVTRIFDVFFDLRLNKRLSKQWWDWWFETLSRPLWRHRNALLAKGTPEYLIFLILISIIICPWILSSWNAFVILCSNLTFHGACISLKFPLKCQSTSSYKYVTAGTLTRHFCLHHDIDGLAQDCSNSSALAMELLQSCT